jgi:mitogen-activated protein kinase kinase kinase 7
MAPEVFMGQKYNEKCDVFSWAIVLWEVLARKLPYYDIDVPPCALAFHVSMYGKRPKLFKNCPKVIEELMIKCWSEDPNERPPMKAVEQTVENIFRFCSEQANEPIVDITSSHTGIHLYTYD